MLLIKQFNQRFAVRRADEYGKPRIIPLEKLQIPRGAILHTVDLDQVVIAPPTTTPYLQELEKPAQIRHHFKLPDEGISGRPIAIPVQGQERKILAYHRDNRRFRRMTEDGLVRKDQKVLLIENYTPALAHYRYPDTLMAWYDRLCNVQMLVATQLKYDTAEYLRQNYMFVTLDNILPAYDRFKVTYNDRIKTKLENFKSYDLLWLLDLFGWAIGKQESTVFSDMDMTQLSRTNIIFVHNSGFTSMNMGLVEKLRKSNGGRLTDDQMARNFYKMLIQLMTVKPSAEYDAEFLSPEGEDHVVMNPEAEQEVVDGADAINENAEGELAPVEDDDFNTAEDFKIEAPKEDVKPTTIVLEKVIDHGAIIKQEVERMAEAGRVTAKSYKFLTEASERFAAQPSPYNPKETYGEAMVIAKKDLEVKPKTTVRKPLVSDPKWMQSTVLSMNKKYNKELLQKDVMAAVASAQRLGMAIHSHTIEKEISVTGNIEHHTLRIQPIGGEPKTVRFQLPILSEDGTWTANGVEYCMRRQRVDLPIRKVDYDTVALTTAYGKNFIRRSDKVVNDYGRWLTNAIVVQATDPTNTTITNAKLANVFNPLVEMPRQYTMIARRISTFNSMGYQFNFNMKDMHGFFGEDVVKSMEDKELVPIAKGRGGVLIGMDNHSQVYLVDGNKITPKDQLVDFLGIDKTKSPKEVTELSLMGKAVSLGFIFSYYLGLTGMLRHFGIQYEILPSGQRIDKTAWDMIIRLADSKLVINCDNDKQRMILNGLQKYLKHFVSYTESEVDREDIYLNLLRDVDGLTPRYLNELRLMRSAYVDDMHARILRKMGEPETFIGLLERANEMLQTDQTKPEINGDEMMFPGTQRLSYHVYTALVRAMRNYNNAPGSNRQFELSQDMVWGAINSDPSVLLTPGANPIQFIKEQDVITMGGTGGRSRKTMVYNTREFQESDLGIVSGNTVDNGDVGITSFLVNNPRFDSIDGTTAPRKEGPIEAPDVLSFIDGLSPDVLMDDAKRQNFINIHWGSSTTTVGNGVALYRTEKGKDAAHRGSVKHARAIDKPGKIILKTDDVIRIKYEDGEEETFQLGRWFGAHEGTYYPHTVVSKWKQGDRLAAGTIITYNADHFEPDLYDPTQVNLKDAMIALVALIEGEEVIEDSNAISERFAAKAQSDVTKVKEVTIRSTQNLLELIKVGDHVDVDTILCTFNDNLGGDTGGFSKEAAQTLYELSAYSPQAGVRGHIDKIEVVYHGDPEDFSPSLQTLINTHDRQRRKLANALGGNTPTSGSVNGDYRIEGVPLAYNALCIKFYITHRVAMAAADKLEIALQLKTTTQDVMPGINRTENGEDLDIIFGCNSVDARIVGSIMRIGTTTSCSVQCGKMVGKILDGESVPALPKSV